MSFKEQVVQRTVGLFGNTVTVTEVKPLSARLLQIKLEGESMQKLAWSPGDKIKLHVGGGAMRSYTPSRFHPGEGWMEVVLHLHGNGAASRWASELVEGQETSFMGPAKSMSAITVPLPWAFFFGDETTIGLAQALYDALPSQTSFSGVIEVDEADVEAMDSFSFPNIPVPRQHHHGAALLSYLEELSFPEGEGKVWLSGEASSVLELRKALLERGLQREQLLIKPYWSLKGKAHRKELERGALRS